MGMFKTHQTKTKQVRLECHTYYHLKGWLGTQGASQPRIGGRSSMAICGYFNYGGTVTCRAIPAGWVALHLLQEPRHPRA